MEIRFSTHGRPTARYASATTVYEEALCHTRLLGLYWSASGQVQRENVTANLPVLDPLRVPLHAFQLEIDGQSLHNRWEWANAGERPGAREGTREGVVELRHQVRPISVKVVTRLDETPFLTRFLEITNTGEAPAALSHVCPWSGVLWHMTGGWGRLPVEVASPFTLGYYRAVDWGAEGDFGWEPLPRFVRRVESRNGASGFNHPFFIVRNEITGELALASLAWSASWFGEFRFLPERNGEGGPDPALGLTLAFRMGPQGPAPQRLIAPGEMIATPAMHLALLHTDLDGAVAAFHEHVHASVFPPKPTGKRYFSVAGRVVEEPGEWILEEIDAAAGMGVEAFMVDAGWYGDSFAEWWKRRGDWQVGDWVPGGLAACRERARAQGMAFGLWMEAETLGEESRTFQEHPEWAQATDEGRQLRDFGRPLDLSHPEAARHFRESVLGVIREHQVDFLKLDYNLRVHEGGQRERDGFAESELWRHCETLYETFDAVRREFPEVTLENCAAGGGRNDLGMLARFDYACVSDLSLFPRSIRAINALTLFLPPERLCYYHNHLSIAHQQADLDTHLRVALFARPIFVGFGARDASPSSEYVTKTKRYVKMIRDLSGPLLLRGAKVFHHTPDLGVHGPADWCVLEYADQDGAAGYVGVFRVGGGGDPNYVVRPRGIRPEHTYRVMLGNSGDAFAREGRELLREGLPTRLEQAGTSELVVYEEARD